MDRTAFLKLVAVRLHPLLRSEGFRGSGNTLRRHAAPVVHIFNIQGSQWGRGCYLNLGAHLDFMPTEGGGKCDPTKLKEYECSFRERLHTPSGPGGQWEYGPSEAAAEQTVDLMVEAWRNQGLAFFGRYSSYPEDFMTLVRAASVTPPHPIDSLRLARIAAHLGMQQEATVLAHAALDGASQAATVLRHNAKELLAKLGAA
jgi:hypothetical protein